VPGHRNSPQSRAYRSSISRRAARGLSQGAWGALSLSLSLSLAPTRSLTLSLSLSLTLTLSRSQAAATAGTTVAPMEMSWGRRVHMSLNVRAHAATKRKLPDSDDDGTAPTPSSLGFWVRRASKDTR
jgi:hypothetical protein